jgi:hypothetical protein
MRRRSGPRRVVLAAALMLPSSALRVALVYTAIATGAGCGSSPSAGGGSGHSSDGGGGGGSSGVGGSGGVSGSSSGGWSGSGDAAAGALTDDAGAGDDALPGANADGGYRLPDGAVLRADRFVTGVVSFTPTACTGYGQSEMPGIVEGPPVGGGSGQGSTDVVSLGSGGSIVLTFAPNAIVDGPGPDFIVFENPFWIGGDPNNPYAEPGEISVSDDGTTWTTFPCAPTANPGAADGTGVAAPYPAACGGWQVVYSTPSNGISPVDPNAAGGLVLDLATIGVTHARYVRIVDKTDEQCPEAGAKPDNNGFDLDAIAIINAETP